MMMSQKTTRGFSLIEVIVYLALFGILMGGAVGAVYGVFESGDRNQAAAILQQEGDFLVAKINWVLSGVKTVDAPAVGASSSSLSVTKWNASIDTVDITESGGTMMISRGGGPAMLLSTTDVSISNLSFTHEYAGGTNPESVSASFTASIMTKDGKTISRQFSTAKFIRR